MDITDKTKVPLILVGATIPFIIGLVLWLGGVSSAASEAQRVNDKQDVRIDAQLSLLLDIRDRVIRIEEIQKHGGR